MMMSGSAEWSGQWEKSLGLTYILEPGVAGYRRPGICPAFESDILALGSRHQPAGILVGQMHRNRGRICWNEAEVGELVSK